MANSPESTSTDSKPPARRPRRRARKAPPVIAALQMAEDMAREAHVCPQERESLRLAAVSVERWLAAQGHPGRWDNLDVGGLLEMMKFPDAHQTAGFLLSLGGLVGHAAFNGELDMASAHRVVSDVRQLTSHPAVTSFAAQALTQFEIFLGSGEAE
jgi:hypothetical protein